MRRLALAAALITACRSAEAGDAAGSADSLFRAGQSLYAEERYDSAHATWSLGLARARAESDEPAQARFLTEMGLAEWRMSDAPRARATQEEALAIKSRLGMHADLPRSRNALGIVAHSENRNREALAHFAEAAAGARASGDSKTLASALGNQALPAANLGDFRTAREAARGLRAAGRAMDDARFEGNGLSNEAWVDLLIGDPRAAIPRLDTARSLYRAIGYQTGEQVALGQLASAWELTGELDRAFAALDTALELSRSLGLREDEAINLRLIAGLHSRAGDYRRAIRFYELAADRFRETSTSSELGLVRRGEAAAYLELGNADRAREQADDAARLHRESGEPHEELSDLVLLAEIARRSGAPATARRYLDSARDLGRRLDTRGVRIELALAEARLADQSGDSRAVLSVLQSARDDFTPGDYDAEGEAAILEARAYSRSGRVTSAVTAGRRAVAAIERQRSRLPSDALRSTLVADRAQVYGDLVLDLLSLGRVTEAFLVADQARSRALVEHLSAIRAGARLPLPAELARGEDLLRRIDILVQRLREAGPEAAVERSGTGARTDTDLTRDLRSARSEYEALLVRAATRDPRASMTLGIATPTVPAVQNALAPDQALLEYLISRGRLVVFVLTTDSIHVSQVPLDPAVLGARVRLLRDLWGTSRSDWRAALPAARALFQDLIQPLETAGWLRDTRQLVVVPHGILGQLPFAALQDERTGRYLMQDFTVTMLPNAGAMTEPDRRVGSAPAMKGTGFAPFPEDLPASTAEVAVFRQYLAASVVRRGKAASESALRRALGEPGTVHVATHGALNARNPMFSRIELARSNRAPPEDDGRLEVHELLGLRIRSSLVFLSGCETGAAQEWTDDPIRGAPDLTLAQAALAAGARQVVSTLWRIDDEGAAGFAGEFYSRLRPGSAAAALVMAQRTLAAQERFASPYYWAGYVLSGGETHTPR